MPIKAIVVDDSAVVRQVISDILNGSRDIRVTAAVADPLFAMERMRIDWPDVVVLDVEMPRMDGITFLRRIMAERPTPVVICSTSTTRGAQTTLRALSAGAAAVVAKPRVGTREHLIASSVDLVDAVRGAAQANVRNLVAPPVRASSRDAAPKGGTAKTALARGVVAIGASTGGTIALEHVLCRLPRTSPGVLVVQHMPEKFTAAFAARLDGVCEIEVREAQDGDEVLQGRALIAPGGLHMTLKRRAEGYRVQVRDGPAVNRHRPSVDVLFRSVAAACADGLGILMTGMGDDGALGLLEMRRAGARTVAQDEESCVVFGMPKEAIALGAAQRVAGLEGIVAEIVQRSG